MKRRIIVLLLTLLYTGFSQLFAAELNVPADYDTIQAAIDAAGPGDVVIVADGVYKTCNLNVFGGRVVRSANGPENCIIDCDSNYRAFYLERSTLEGFTIINASGENVVECSYRDNVIRNCVFSVQGTINADSGCIYITGETLIEQCVFYEKKWPAVYCKSAAQVRNCSLMAPGTAICSESYNVTVKNCLIAGDISAAPSYLPTLSYCGIPGGFEGEGNIDVDAEVDFTPDGHLMKGSVCIDTGDPNYVVVSEDLDGDPRIYGGRVDIGADEFVDSDGDRLPDWWEVKYFGDINSGEADIDFEGDGRSNKIEYEIFSSNPLEAGRIIYVSMLGYDEWSGENAEVSPDYDPNGPKHSVQGAIDAAVSGDTVVVLPGTYSNSRTYMDSSHVTMGYWGPGIRFYGKRITVRSLYPDRRDFVEGTQIYRRYSAAMFRDGESRHSVLEGLTLVGGEGTRIKIANEPYPSYLDCGSVIIENSSPTIRGCIIKSQAVICSRYKYLSMPEDYPWTVPNIEDLRSPYPSAMVQINPPKLGGGMAILGDCNALIENCLITKNEIVLSNFFLSPSKAYGGGIYIYSSNPQHPGSTIANCTIAGNFLKDTDTILTKGDDVDLYQVDCRQGRCKIINSIIAGGFQGDGLLISDPNCVSYCCIDKAKIYDAETKTETPFDFGQTETNINNGAFIVRWPFKANYKIYYDCWDGPCYLIRNINVSGDFHLMQGAGCINAGDPDWQVSGVYDLDGDKRIIGGRIDIGADEFVPEIKITHPSANDVVTSGSELSIRWDLPVSVDDEIIVDQSLDGGANWITVGTVEATAGKYILKLNDLLVTDQCKIKLSLAGEPDISTETGEFSVRPFNTDVTANSTWPSLSGGFLHRGLSQFAGPVVGCVEWRYDANATVTTPVTIGIEDRIHFGTDSGKIVTLDSNGVLLWQFDAGESEFFATSSIGPDGTIYIGNTNGKFYAIGKDGQLKWTFTTGAGIYSSAAVGINGNIYFGSQNGYLYALSNSGSELWRFKTAGIDGAAGTVFASPAIGINGDVYAAGLYDPNLYAFDANDGSLKWVCRFEDVNSESLGRIRPWAFTSPTIAEDGTIYQSLVFDANLYAIEPNDGSIRWACYLSDVNSGLYEKYSSAGKSGWSEVTLGPDGTIFINLDDPYLRAVDADGQIKWVRRLGMQGGFAYCVGADGLIYCDGQDGYLSIVNADGIEQKRYRNDTLINTSPVITANGLLLICSEENIIAFGDAGCQGPGDFSTPVDINGDGMVNMLDLFAVAQDWLRYCQDGYLASDKGWYLAGDIDRNTEVDFKDLALMILGWTN